MHVRCCLSPTSMINFYLSFFFFFLFIFPAVCAILDVFCHLSFVLIWPTHHNTHCMLTLVFRVAECASLFWPFNGWLMICNYSRYKHRGCIYLCGICYIHACDLKSWLHDLPLHDSSCFTIMTDKVSVYGIAVIKVPNFKPDLDPSPLMCCSYVNHSDIW
jgi:hypothetical protein